MFKVHLLCLLRFYQAYCTLVMRYCYVTGGVCISFQISRSTVEMSTAPQPRSVRCGFGKICRVPAAPRDF